MLAVRSTLRSIAVFTCLVLLGAGAAAGYTVRPGDTLSGIAAKTGTTVDAIVAANGWEDGQNHLIYPGLEINMPSTSG